MLSINNFDLFKKFLVGSEADPDLLYKTSTPALGLYQFTPGRLKDVAAYIGVSVPSPSEFLNNPKEQDLFFQNHIEMILNDISDNSLDQFLNTPVIGANKYPYPGNITLWGLIAGEHLGGLTGLKKFLIQGIDSNDSNGTYISDYVSKFSNYELQNSSGLNIASIGVPGILGIILLIGLIFAIK